METSEWIKTIQNQIIENEDKTLFVEASGCLTSGFYRAGYVIAWISIVESLKRKIFESYNIGDKQAENSYLNILDAESKKISVDKIILEEAIQLKLVEEHDQSKLNYLWEQRCIFAHPYLKAPTEDDLKYIISSSIEICFSKPLLYRKNYIDEISENLISKPYFLTDDKDKTQLFARRIITRVPIELHPYFFKTLLYKLGTIIDDEKKIKTQLKIRYFIIELLKITTLDLSDKNWSLEYRATNFPFVCLLGLVHSDIWQKLPQRFKEIIIEYSITEENNDKQIIIRQIIGYLLKNNTLEIEFKKKFTKKLNSIEFKNSYSYYSDALSLYNRILQEFTSNKYVRKNAVVDFLRDQEGQIFISSIDKEKQIHLGWQIMLSARTNSWTAQSYLRELGNLKETTSDVKKGILFGSIFSSEDYIFIKKDYLEKAVRIVDKLSDNEILDIFNYQIDHINSKDTFNEVEESEIDGLTTLDSDFKAITLRKLDELKDKLKKHCT